MRPYIRHIPKMVAIAHGIPDNCDYIQIVDYDMESYPVLGHDRKLVVNFFDTESGDGVITSEQAMEIVLFLLDSFNRGKSVVVSCIAGVCRSGAVAQVGEIIGFDYDSKKQRIIAPNLMVKNKLREMLYKIQPVL